MDSLEGLCSLPPWTYIPPNPLDNPDVTFNLLTSKYPPRPLNVVYSKASELKPIYGDQTIIPLMHGKREEIVHADNEAYITEGYPFEFLSTCGMVNRCGTKLANIDYHFEVTGPRADITTPQIPGPFNACDIASGPGGFTSYIFFRRPGSKVYGMTYDINFDQSIITNPNFTRVTGLDGGPRGDLFVSYNKFIEEVLYSNADGYDLVTGDAGFMSVDGLLREVSGFPLLLIESYVGIRVCKPGGNFVVKGYETLTESSAGLIYLLSQLFETVSIFKPITSRSYNLESYIICKNRNMNQTLNTSIDAIIKRMLSSDKYKQFPVKLFDLPPDFVDFITRNNNLRIHMVLNSMETLKYLQETKMQADIPRVDLHKFILYLNLPPETHYVRRTRAEHYKLEGDTN